MDSPMKQAAKLVQAKKGGSRMFALFLCLALLVTAGTVTAFVLHGHTQTHTHRVLECSYEVHAHTEDCYPGGDTAQSPICGLADFVVHVHNDDCRDEAGALVCTLDEVEAHEHGSDCYTAPLTCTTPESAAHAHDAGCYAPAEGAALTCGQEEREAVPGHAHTDECYTAGEAVLACGQEEAPAHHHDDSCYTTTETRDLTCGQEEGGEHQHDDSCYTVSTSTELTCGQAETEGHSHSEACYQATSVLSCGKEEGEGAVEGHAHTNSCYAEADLVIACGKEEGEGHAHSAECYGEEELTCGKDEIVLHTHSEECFAEMTKDEKAAGAEHGALTCGKLQVEEHTHSEDCFKVEEMTPEEIAAQDAAAQKPGVEDLSLVYSDENIVVTVDYDTAALLPADAAIELVGADTPAPVLDVTQQVVPAEPEATDAPDAPDAEQDAETGEEGGDETEDKVEDKVEDKTAEPETPDTTPETTAEPENTDTAPAEDLTGLVRAGFMADGREWLPAATVTYTVQYLLDGQPAGEPVVYSFTPGGALPCFAPAIETFTQTVETEEFIVTARYTALAELGDAELYAAAIEDEEQVEAYTAQYREAVNSSRARMHALMDIGFVLNGAEVQPAAPVEITVQLLGEDGLPAGEPLTVVHFGEDTEIIAAKADETGAAAFRMNSFSPVGIGQTPESDDEGRALLNEQNGTFEWTDPNGLYHIRFEVGGVIAPMDKEPAGDGDAEAPEEEAAAGAPENEDEADTTDIPLATAGLLNFLVKPVDEDDELYAAYLDEANEDPSDLLNLSVLRYSLLYGGVEMSLDNCEITVTISPTMEMQAMAEQYSQDNPADNGDTDHDGYVETADGEALLPAPAMQRGVLFSAVAPSADDEKPVSLQGTILLDGAGAEVDQDVTASAAASAADMGSSDEDTESNGEGQTQAPAGEVEVSTQSVTFTIVPQRMDGTPEQGESIPMQTISATVEAAGTPVTADGTVMPKLNTPAATVSALMQEIRASVRTAGAPAHTAGREDSTVDASPYSIAVFAAAEINPHYTVQYYANLKVITTDSTDQNRGRKTLALIDTTGGVLPQNSGATLSTTDSTVPATAKVKVRYMYLLQGGVVKTETKLQEVYKAGTGDNWTYFQKPGIAYADKLLENNHYELAQIWVLKDGRSPTSTNEGDWDTYSNIAHLHFTNRTLSNNEKVPGETYITIKDGATLRFVYNISERNMDFEAAFYDYDITNGYIYSSVNASGVASGQKDTDQQTNGRWFARTDQQGINSPENYTNNGYKDGDAKLAFGNINTSTTLGMQQWNGALLNKHNSNQKGTNPSYKSYPIRKHWPTGSDAGYEGCTFGLVQNTLANSTIDTNTGFPTGGTIQYASGVSAPKLFNETGTVTGKTSFGDYTLSFIRQGDTYTLASVNNTTTGATAVGNLNCFTNTTGSIWSNNFWPMDDASTYGAKGHDLKFGQKDLEDNRRFFGGTVNGELGYLPSRESLDTSFPLGDDGLDHNSYFGMRYEVGFELVEDYVGPLNYCFFGDDDMWVYLSRASADGRSVDKTMLVCDIGGVHSSVGEYIDLWDYIAKMEGKTVEQVKQSRTGSSKYTLTFFYTERGASGSTCWMQFTLPSVNSLTPEFDDTQYGRLLVRKTMEKQVNNEGYSTTAADNGEEFEFYITFSGLKDDHKYEKFDKDGKLIASNLVMWSGATFTLKDGEYIIIENLPVGTTYTITELTGRVKAGKENSKVREIEASRYEYNTGVTIIDKPAGKTEAEEREYQQPGSISSVTIDGKTYSGQAIASGTIQAGQQPVEVTFTNRYTVYRMPKTGGVPGIVYTGSGALLIVLAAAAYTQRKRRKKAEGPSVK